MWWGVILLCVVAVGVGGVTLRRKRLTGEAKSPPLLPPPEELKKWEKDLERFQDLDENVRIRVVDVPVREDPKNHETLLNELYRRGWTPIEAVPLTSHTPEIRYVLQRRKGYWVNREVRKHLENQGQNPSEDSSEGEDSSSR